MKRINKDLIGAARNGDEAGLKALLLRPGCDPKSKDGGWTALMYAAYYGRAYCTELLVPVSDALAKANNGVTALMLASSYGHAACVKLLIPVSDASAKDYIGRTASDLARNSGNNSLAALIDVYSLALSEMSTLGSLVAPGALGKKASLRV